MGTGVIVCKDELVGVDSSIAKARGSVRQLAAGVAQVVLDITDERDSSSMRPPLRRARANSADMPAPLLTGVCSGLSIHAKVSVRAVRVLMVITALFFGAGLFLYAWLWVTVPLDDLKGTAASTDGPVAKRRIFSGLKTVTVDRRPQMVTGQLLVAGAGLILLAVMVIIFGLWYEVPVGIILPGIAIVGGLLLTWSQVSNLGNWKSPWVISKIGSGLALVLTGLIAMQLRGKQFSDLLSGGLFGAVLVLGVLVALAPIWLNFASNLSEAKASEVRESERADIAAHLHDSVLQTLTLIRASASDPVRVRALSLTQERELRSWLYTDREEAGRSAAQSLRDQVGAIESTYGIEVAVVAVGDVVPGVAESAAVAAASEAAANAVRHGLPPVSVYLEVTTDSLEIYVKDAGKGFDVSGIPPDRHGVCDSIIGRVERVGGHAEIRSRVKGLPGTEVHIRVPLSDFEAQASDPPIFQS